MVTIAAAARRCGLLDVNLARGRWRDFRQRDRQHAIGQVRRDLLDVNLVGELERARERAVAAFDLMEVQDAARAGPIRAVSPNRQPAVFEGQIDLLAAQPGSSAVTTNDDPVS